MDSSGGEDEEKTAVIPPAPPLGFDPLQLYSRSQLCAISSNMWSRPATALLIEMYRKLECLWKTTSPYYRHRKKRYEALQEIAKAIEPYRPDTTAEDVKNKINGLRTQYVYEKNKMLEYNGKGPTAPYEPTLWCYYRLSFLAGYTSVKNKYLAGGGDCSSGAEDSIGILTPLIRERTSSSIKRRKAAQDGGVERVHEVHDEEVEDDVQESGESKSSPGERSRTASISLPCSTVKHDEEGDGCDIFGKFVATQLKLIKDPELAMKLQHTIQSAIMDAQLQEMKRDRDNE